MKKTLARLLLTWCRPHGKRDQKADPFARPLFLLAGLAAILAFTIDGSPTIAYSGKAPPPEYRLDTMDRIQLRVFEWRPALDEVFEWKALNDEYTVGPGGGISVPLLGQVPVTGKTLQQVGDEIGDMIRTRIGIVAVPKISVEIVRFRPFYILGQVQKPGEYDFRPQLTVLQAVSLAGGLSRTAAETDVSKDLISFKGEINLLNKKYVALLARRARLVSVLNSDEKIDFPSELVSRQYQIGQVLDHEAALFRADRASFKASLTNLETRKEYLSESISSLEQQIDNQAEERKLAHEELAKVKQLVARKLTVEPRRLAAQKNVYQLEGLKLRLESDLLRAKQDMEEVISDIIKLRNEHSNSTITNLRDTQAEIDEVLERMTTLDSLYSNAAMLAPASALAMTPDSVSAKYEIIRSSGGYSKVIEAEETSRIEPGDTVRVKMQSPDLSAVRGVASIFPRGIPLPDLKTPTAMVDAARNFYTPQPAVSTPSTAGVPSSVRPRGLRQAPSAIGTTYDSKRQPSAVERPEASRAPVRQRPAQEEATEYPFRPEQEAAREGLVDKQRGAVLEKSSVPLPVRRPPSPIEEAMIFPERSPMRLARAELEVVHQHE